MMLVRVKTIRLPLIYMEHFFKGKELPFTSSLPSDAQFFAAHVEGREILLYVASDEFDAVMEGAIPENITPSFTAVPPEKQKWIDEIKTLPDNYTVLMVPKHWIKIEKIEGAQQQIKVTV